MLTNFTHIHIQFIFQIRYTFPYLYFNVDQSWKFNFTELGGLGNIMKDFTKPNVYHTTKLLATNQY